jgi:hypothetical protein
VFGDLNCRIMIGSEYIHERLGVISAKSRVLAPFHVSWPILNL